EKLHANSVSDGSALLLAEIMVIPDGLEPRDANGNELAIGMRGSVAIARRAEVLSAAGAARNVAEGQVKQGSPSLPDPTPEPTL
ncbi:hypothetical protein ACSLVQ_29590, partial [Klebsiella pneumoniae]|uniref:hypothetical protein n=1 Tax=Klebsiella pneumoniae TaxID=573 RepID=UPI003EE0358A